MMREFKLCLKNLECRQATSIYDLSDDNLSEIFYRLPVRGLLCCQCVCKRFNKLITNPKFKGIHVKRAITSDTTSFCSVSLHGIDVRGSNKIINFRYDQILLENTQRSVSFSYLRLSNPLSCKIYIIGSCNGLMCARLEALEDRNESYMLIWNPVTRENRFVAEPKIIASSTKIDLVLAFGFTQGTNDYKVVRIISCGEPGTVLDIKLEVFNMCTDKWSAYEIKTLQCREIDHMPPLVDPNILLGIFSSHNNRSRCLRGAIHWLSNAPRGASRNYTGILSFDLEEEKLRLFTVLDTNKIPRVESGMLDCINDSLLVIVPHHLSHPSTNFDIWVMNDYGDRNSWIKKYTFVDQFPGHAAEPIGYWKDDLFLMAKTIMYERFLCLYNLRSQEMKFFPVTWHFLSATFCDYVETYETVSRAIATTGEPV